MKTHISNKQLSQHGYENSLLNRIDSRKKPHSFGDTEGPFNTALADALKEFFSKKQPQKRGEVLPENRVSAWNTMHLEK